MMCSMLFVMACLLTAGDELTGHVWPGRLTCEYRVTPLSIDASKPRLGWVVESDHRGQVQTAYQVMAASSEEELKADRADLWDSGKVKSSDSVHVVYAGRLLASGQRVYWKVRVCDREGRVSAWSEPVWWEMGLLGPEDWKGQWICSPRPLPDRQEDFYADNPAPLLRREFDVRGQIKRARAYVSGLGYYELRLNGRKVGDRMLDPGWTSYAKRVLYSTYDVTDLLKEGQNAVGIVVGNGWYNPLPLRMWGRLNLQEHLAVGKPRAILQLDIEYVDGTRQSVGTGDDWKAGDSPILRNSVYLGEVYDARREQPGWDMAGFADADWPRAVAAGESVGPLCAQMQPPIRVTRVLKPTELRQSRPGLRLFDFGQNFAGVVRLKVKGPAGRRVAVE